MQHEQVELVRAATLEGFLGRHDKIFFIALRATKSGFGEAGVALRSAAETRVEIMTDNAGKGVFITGEALESFAQKGIRPACTVNVRSDETPCPLLERTMDEFCEMVVVEGLTEVLEPPQRV